MEMLSRRAFGFRNFENYRLRIRGMCAQGNEATPPLMVLILPSLDGHRAAGQMYPHITLRRQTNQRHRMM